MLCYKKDEQKQQQQQQIPQSLSIELQAVQTDGGMLANFGTKAFDTFLVNEVDEEEVSIIQQQQPIQQQQSV